ncbi:MAG: LLM class flavin-dependent oxidoreductase [Candidatus Tectomicrobia bacterium]|uniref:LLM class flavin-dependent oxidoreductase n=1 Tax=Tectimicrobiota bacterium TaxID=2528274 RepID=A0A937W1S1_UNCTE|nr:LLM class flavin-dependent oxidoreductase [Candidatus Tectomicrobia bacterium]
MRQITLVAFLQAQNCTTLPASWRHPEARIDSTSPEYYRHIGRVLEAGKFDIGFFDDRLAMPDLYTGNHAHTVAHGIRCIKMDPVVVLMTMGMATERLGLGATYSTTYHQPFHVARAFATLDLMTQGRAAWNVVTSVNDNEARNMGLDGVMDHDLRYDRADEFMEIVHGHWDTWEDDAIVIDKTTGLYAAPEKVHRLDHVGTYYKSRGPFTVPRSPQGHPVVIQAGQSERGRRFAARWGELIFVSYRNVALGQAAYAELKAAAAQHGRDPADLKITTLTFPVVGESLAEAEDKRAAYDQLTSEIDALSLLSEALNFDFASKGRDEPFSDAELAGIEGIQALRDSVLRTSGKRNPTPRDFMHFSGRGRLGHPWVGGPKELADMFEEWFVSRACDGFVIGPTHLPGAFEDFVRLVVPELQRRKLFRQEYTGTTLRDHLGLARPEVRVRR